MVNNNIGKLEHALQSGIRAANHIDYSPVINAITNQKSNVKADWGNQPIDLSLFVMAIHRWGDKKHRVSK